jgi:hypothetical protein
MVLGDLLLGMSVPEPIEIHLSLLEMEIRHLTGRIAYLESRTFPARYRRLKQWLGWRVHQAILRVRELWR